MQRRQRGTSLVEVLVVIVIFLVGILAILQIFPGGLSVLRTTSNNTVAANLARAQMQQIKGTAGELADVIAPVEYFFDGTNVAVIVRPDRNPNDLMPDQGAGGGTLAGNGNILIDGNPIGNWARVSGSNLFSRVIGERKPIPTPRLIGGELGSLLNLQFAPIYYTAVGSPTISPLQIYGNDFIFRGGRANRNGEITPGNFDTFSFVFVRGDRTGDEFSGEDQIFIRQPNTPRPSAFYRIEFTYYVDTPNGVEATDIIIPVELALNGSGAFYQTSTQTRVNSWVISIPRLVDGFGLPNYLGVSAGSLRVQRLFTDIPSTDPFTPNDPYEYKVISDNLGTIIINPRAKTTRVRTQGSGGRVPLQANVDYTVFDWRIIRDEFRVPTINPFTQKLLLRSLKVRGNTGPDGLTWSGLDIPAPDAAGAIGDRDFILQDVETGGIISPAAYAVDYRQGAITFNSLGGGEVPASLFIPQPGNTFIEVPVADIRGRSVRALYQANGEWALQVLKAARTYRIRWIGPGVSLQTGEAFVGGSQAFNTGDPIGVPTRLYFPIADLGQSVIVGQIWATDGTRSESIVDQQFLISSVDPVLNLAFVELAPVMASVLNADPANVRFSYEYGFAVGRVRGASVRVRALWNPDSFNLSGSPEENFRNLEVWMRGYRRVETESFAVGGLN